MYGYLLVESKVIFVWLLIGTVLKWSLYGYLLVESYILAKEYLVPFAVSSSYKH